MTFMSARNRTKTYQKHVNELQQVVPTFVGLFFLYQNFSTNFVFQDGNPSSSRLGGDGYFHLINEYSQPTDCEL